MNHIAFRSSLVFLTAASLALGSCNSANQIPVMGNHTVYEVNMEELSGLSFNQDRTALLACGDKGTVKEVSFEGEILKNIWTKRSDVEGITVNPSTGDIYIAVERAQEIHRLSGETESEPVITVQEAAEGRFGNDGLEAVEFYKDDTVFIGSQRGSNLWTYNLNGEMISKISLSSFASEIAGLCYDPEADLLWVTDSEMFKIFLCTTEGELLATYDVPFIENAESICVDRARGCVWVGSDEDSSKIYKIDFKF